MSNQGHSRALVNAFHHVDTNARSTANKMIIIERIDGKKSMTEIDNPDFHFRVSKKEKVSEHAKMNPVFVPEEETDRVDCKQMLLFGHMMQLIRDRDTDVKRKARYEKIFRDNVQKGNLWALRKLHSHPIFHGTDIEYTDYYILKYLNENNINAQFKLTKSYFDIESDTIEHIGFPDEAIAPCPTNAISYCNDETGKTYGLFLRNAVRENPLIPEFEKKLPEFIEYMNNKYKIKNLIIEFFDTELELTKYFFNIVNEVDRPDAINAWNLSYDFRTLQGRIKKLTNDDPAIIMCPKDFQHIKSSFYYKDKHAKDIFDKKDYAQVNGYTMWLDQMLSFARLRATGSREESYALDYILTKYLGVGKVALNAGEIKYLPYTDYWKFCEYSIMDTYRLSSLEAKLKDLDLLYAISLLTKTRMSKAMTKTTALRNLAAHFFEQQGVILSNNRNQNQLLSAEDLGQKFKGAFVGNPNLMLPTGITIDGRRSTRVYDLVFDLDLASLYPNIILSHNIDAEPLFFRITINRNGQTEKIETGKNKDKEVLINFAPDLMNSLISGDKIKYSEDWCGGASFEEYIDCLDY